ncbi:hypothetical protein HO675_05130 [Streptococcus suis]|nr:hypothetical protein [Streptococcus suis]
MLKEIGSEFWNMGFGKKDRLYFLSGRTALYHVIQDIRKERRVVSVQLPSYCCQSMIEPFIRNGISVRFYSVYYDQVNGLSISINEPIENEIFYFMTYFGFQRLHGLDYQKIKNDFSVVIEDRTHSWLSSKDSHFSDYSYVSVRKWCGLDGIAIATKKSGDFFEFPTKTNSVYSNLRLEAFRKKKDFIELGKGEKRDFLQLFQQAEEILNNNYINYLPSNESIVSLLALDKENISKIRRKNASILIDGVRDISSIELLFPTLQNCEVPLFVPILVNGVRDQLRQFLIENKIFCPIHWPKSTYHHEFDKNSECLYANELSLVCDQRYGTDDMERLVEVLKKFFK